MALKTKFDTTKDADFLDSKSHTPDSVSDGSTKRRILPSLKQMETNQAIGTSDSEVGVLV